MSRSGPTIRRKVVEEDPIYKDKLVSKFINRVMFNGKKTAAQKEVYNSFLLLKEKHNQDPMLIFHQAIDNVKPQMEVRSRRVGGAAYQIPVSVRTERKDSLAIRWIITAAKKRPNKEFHTFAEKLAAEFNDAFNNLGGAIKKKEDTHRMAEANKAFAHFRW